MELVCSAGISYLLVYPNGDLYRCMADYNARRPPLGNLLDEKLALFDEPKRCTHPRCYAACDIDWASKWLLDERGQVTQHIRAQETGDLVPIAGELWKSQELPDRILRDAISIVWAPTLICNYDCNYCGCALGVYDIHKTFPSAAGELTVDQWLEAFEKLTSRFRWGMLRVTGGEPFVSRALVPVIKEVSKKFLVNISSNLSRDLVDLTRLAVKPYDPQTRTGVYFTASLHPSAKLFNFDQFLGRVLYLKHNGYPLLVNFVAYPEQMYAIDHYREIFARHGVDVDFTPWCGTDNRGRTGYLPHEQAFVDSKANSWRKSEQQIVISDMVFNNAYVATLACDDAPEILSNGTQPLRFRVTNRGTRTWTSTPADADQPPIKFGWRIQRTQDSRRTVVFEGRCDLPQPLSPGESVQLELTPLDRSVPLGKYEVTFDMVCEGNFWFQDLGGPTLTLPLAVEPELVSLDRCA